MFDERTIQQLAQAIASRILPQIEKGNSHGGKGVPKRLLTVKDAAAYLGRSESGLYHLVSRREITCVRHGRNLRFDVVELDRWIRGDAA